MAEPADASTDAHAPTAFALGYRPQLDGLRAVAVLAVMAFHADVFFHERSLSGGFLGVDLFFALSGFLITTILAEEWLRRDRIDLRAFYARRGLRLLPAVVVMLGAVVVYTVVVLNSSAGDFVRRQALWTLLYVQNWHIIDTRPGILVHLSHTWSLSVEEQFYLLWPLLLLLVLAVRPSPRVMLGVVLAGAAASALAMVLISRGDPQHIHAYYGTETRAQTLLLGAALGLAAVFGKLPAPGRRWPALAGWLGAAFFVVAFATYREGSAFTTQGGLTLAAVAAVALIFGVVCAPQTLLARALAMRGPVAIGRISYGLYLWHLPVFLVVTPHHNDFTIWDTGLSFWPLLAVRFAVTFAIAFASFVLVERPCLSLKRRFERRDDTQGTPMVLGPGVTVSS